MNNDSTDRILAGLRAWIASAPAGARLPSNRSLSGEYGASPVTVQKAMHSLKALGLIEARPGVGTFVSAGRIARPVDYGWQTSALGSPQARLPSLSSTHRMVAPDTIALHSGYPARDLLPTALIRAAIARAARGDSATTRAPAAGLPELQAWFAAELTSSSPSGMAAVVQRDVLIVPGSQSGLSSIFRTLVGPGQPLVIESPTYWGAIVASVQAGVTLIPVPAGPDGPEPNDVDRALAQSGARAFYAQPTYANPTGAQWSVDRSRAVLDIVRRHGAFLVEDDWAHDLGIDTEPRPIAALDDDGHVIYLRSLTKSVSPALRVAAVIARGPARARILADRAAESMYVSGLLQTAALDVVSQSAWRTHLRGLRQQLRERRNVLLTSIREHLPTANVDRPPVGGLNLWVRLPETTELDPLVRACATRGVTIAPGAEWFPAEASGPFIRLNYSGGEPDRYPEAAAAIAEALAEQP